MYDSVCDVAKEHIVGLLDVCMSNYSQWWSVKEVFCSEGNVPQN